MRVMNQNDYTLMEKLVQLNQSEMRQAMNAHLRKKYEEVITTKEYIVAIGNIPVALVAHMDTVFNYPVENMYYDPRKGVLWSSEGLGADDRAGIWTILKVLQTGLRPTVIFTTDEEKGGIGASTLGKRPCPTELKYLIQLDRRGTNDCVFYDCYNPEFMEYVSSFGFVEKIGSFSDISYLMPAWKICGVNLSVGYENEHSMSETLHIKPMYDTLNKVINMLKDIDNCEKWEYKELDYSVAYGYGGRYYYDEPYSYDGWVGNICHKCKKPFSEYELFPIKNIDGRDIYVCPDCIIDNVGWCDYCGEGYVMTDPTRDKICDHCWEELNGRSEN